MKQKTLEELFEWAKNNPPSEEELKAQQKNWVRGELAIGLDRAEAKWRQENMKK